MAATMISGSMCFSRLICSIVWYSRLAIPVSPWTSARRPSAALLTSTSALQLHHQVRIANPRVWHTYLAILHREFHHAIRVPGQAPLKILQILHRLVQPYLRQPPDEPLVVRRLDQLPVQP